MYSSILLIAASLVGTTLASPVAASSTTSAAVPFTSSAHHGPDAPYDVEVVYRGPNNTMCNGEHYKVAVLRDATVATPYKGCVTFDNPAMTFQIGVRPESQQVGYNYQGIGCGIVFFTTTDCSANYNTLEEVVGSIPGGDTYPLMTTYGTCYKSNRPARSAAIGCGP